MVLKIPIATAAACALLATACGTQQGSGTLAALSSPLEAGICFNCPDLPKTPTSIPPGRYSEAVDFVFTQTVMGEDQDFAPIRSPVVAMFGEEGEPLHDFENSFIRKYLPITAGQVLARDPETGATTHSILSVEEIEDGVVVQTKVTWPTTVDPPSVSAELTETYTMNADGTMNYEATGTGSSEDGSVTISIRANAVLVS